MEAKEIDICICFYNTPLNYFKKCLNSVINQTNKNFNLILLNDGSTDTNIEEYLNNEILNKNFGFDISYHKQENKQLFFSRIEILKFTVSEYIYYFDSDDILKPDAIDNMIEAIYTNKFGCKADIFSFGADMIREGKIKNNFISFRQFGLITNDKCDYNILNFFFDKYGGWNIVMWNKIYRASLLKEIYFEVYDELNEKNSFFEHEDCLHNILIFIHTNSFLEIEKNIITHRLDENRYVNNTDVTINKNKELFYKIIYLNNLIKIIRNKKIIKNKSNDYKRILYKNLYICVYHEITDINYFIYKYSLEDYIKSIDINIDPSIKFDNGKLIFENKNIL